MTQEILDINTKIEQEINNIIKKDNKIIKKILIFSGGGVKGIAYFGVLKALDELGILKNIETIATTSVGAMVATLYLFGYSIIELEEFYKLFEFKNLTIIDELCLDNFANLIERFGLDDGKNIIKVISKLAEGKKLNKDITFLELYKHCGKKLIMATTNLTDNKIEYLSYETHPNLKITDGIRMTTCVPLYYEPVILNNKMYVDGGCIDNYPIGLFKDKLEEVIGFYLNFNPKKEEIKNIKDFLSNIMTVLSKNMNNKILNGWENYTINIITDITNILKFNISIEDKIKLFNNGYETTLKNKNKIFI